MREEIGFVGIGTMGSRMARNLLKIGYNVTVCDVREEAVDGLVKEGAGRADNPKEVSRVSTIIMLSLPVPSVSETVVLGKNGVLEGARKGSIIVELSTVPPAQVRRFAKRAKEKGVSVIDCPVSGGPEGAETGTLKLFVGGNKEDLDRCRDVLNAIGQKIYYLGPVGSGETMKLINNLMVHIIRTGTLEAMSLAVKAGIDLKVMLEIINSSSGQSWMMNNMLPKLVSRKKTHVSVRNAYAVTKAVYDLGRELNVSSPVLESAMRVWSYYIAEGLGNEDLTEVAAYMERILGEKITF